MVFSISYLFDLLRVDLGVGEVADEAKDPLIEGVVGRRAIIYKNFGWEMANYDGTEAKVYSI